MESAIDIPLRSPDAVKQPKLRTLYDYGNRIRGDRMMPARPDFDPVDVSGLLRDLILVDVERNGNDLRFRYRLAGTAVVDFLGLNLTGRYVDEVVSPSAYRQFHETYRAPVLLRKPVYSSTGLVLSDTHFPKMIDRLILPMSSDGVTVDLLLNIQSFEREIGENIDLAEIQDYRLIDIFAIDV